MKHYVQLAAQWIAIILVFPLVLISNAWKNLAFFQGVGQFLALIPGKAGSYFRMAYYVRTLKECSPRATIEFGSFFSHWDVVVEDGVYVSAYCLVARCVLEENVMLSAYTHVLDGGHQHGISDAGTPFQSQEAEGSKRVIVGKGSWIGTKAVIMEDIAPYTVVGAGAVVTRKLPGNCVVGGVPAKVIREL